MIICDFFLGTVKKLAMMKIIHEKYKTTKKTEDPVIADFHQSFEDAIQSNKEITTYLNKAQEILNPLKVLQLFENISDEVNYELIQLPY